MSNPELVVIAPPTLSHLGSMVQATKLLLARHHRLTITILIINLPKSQVHNNNLPNKFTSISNTAVPRLRFIELPNDDHNIPAQSNTFLFDYINSQIDNIRKIVSGLIEQPSFPDSRLVGLVLDMFCLEFLQVAEEFDIPSYVFFTSGACSLGLFWDLGSLKFEQNQDLKQYKDSDIELDIRCFSQPLPAKVLPPVFVDDGPMGDRFLSDFKRISETKGILINTFYEFESYAIDSLVNKYNSPKIYPIGPILEATRGDGTRHTSNQLENEVMGWLDNQAENSVVFLCFGTMGTFEETQVKEFAKALEDSGSRFLWSLRKPGETGRIKLPVEYENFEEVLPEGFLERTKGVGKVIGWAPQVAVLSHAAVGGFVSHCGWNSTLESVWFGVPVVALPMYAEQQMNAFQLVRELGIAEAIRIDYKMDMNGETKAEVVPAEEIEAAIRRVMREGGVRGKVKEMQRRSREVLEEGGSSYKAQIQFIEDVFGNVGLE